MESEKIQNNGSKEMSFWEHLDDLRGTVFRIAGGIVVCMILVFANKHIVFDIIVFGPTSSDFLLYRWLCKIGETVSMPALCIEPFKLNFQNISVSGQFFSHITTSFWFGIVLSFPWIIYQLWRFVSPALYENERRAASRAFSFSSLLFFAGAVTGYLFVVPLAVRFLGLYQVADAVNNIITLTSYIDTFVMLIFGMGLAFQMPVVLLVLSRIGVIHRSFLKKYRRHAIVIIVIIAAIITPTPDPMTMLIVSAPLLILYEFSIYLCKK